MVDYELKREEFLKYIIVKQDIGVLLMGVARSLARVVGRVGRPVVVFNERRTRHGGITRYALIDMSTLNPVRPVAVVPSTAGTHPYVVFVVEPGREYLMLVYNRSSSGYGQLKIYRMRPLPQTMPHPLSHVTGVTIPVYKIQTTPVITVDLGRDHTPPTRNILAKLGQTLLMLGNIGEQGKITDIVKAQLK